jgi:hypothetical protein
VLKTIRRVVWCVAVATVLAIFLSASPVRADDDNSQDYNAYWQRQAEIQAALQRQQ